MNILNLLIPLRKYKNYRYLFIGQMVSFLGTMMTYISVPYQVYQVTKSSYMAGLLGLFELVAVLLFALWGGVYADKGNRKKLVIISELAMIFFCGVLFVNSLLPDPSVWPIFVSVFGIMGANSFHRPAMGAMVQKMVEEKDFPYVSSLTSIIYGTGAIIGPTLGGYLTGGHGVSLSYGIDLMTFVISLLALLLIKGNYNSDEEDKAKESNIEQMKSGLSYAKKSQVLLGTYFIDIVAMTFAYPVVLFPLLIKAWEMPDTYLGYPMAALSVGALIAGALGGEISTKIRHKGRVVIISAFTWGICIILMGLSKSFILALSCLFISGLADGASGVFRTVIWNETIPNKMRGRLGSIEMISYMSGPLLGNFRAGVFAGSFGLMESLLYGGILCSLAVFILAFFLPKFWNYTSK